jgi:sulfofructose kinase
MSVLEDRSLFDVLGLGVVAIDDVLHVQTYPPANVKIPVLGRQRYVGGLTATALMTVARLGCKSAYAGVLGDDEFSQYVEASFKQHGVDVTHLVRRPGARPVISTIVIGSEDQTRTIFYDPHGAVGAHAELPERETIRRSRVLFVDHYGMEGMIRAATIAREANIPIVADFESADSPRFPELLALVDHLIVSHDFAIRLTGVSHPANAASKLWTEARKVVVITCGVDGAWYLADSHGDSARFQSAFKVNTVDSNGCGDVFHGAYAATLALGLDAAERVRFASATAALKAKQPGGPAGLPTYSDVELFLQDDQK